MCCAVVTWELRPWKTQDWHKKKSLQETFLLNLRNQNHNISERRTFNYRIWKRKKGGEKPGLEHFSWEIGWSQKFVEQYNEGYSVECLAEPILFLYFLNLNNQSNNPKDQISNFFSGGAEKNLQTRSTIHNQNF